MKIASRNVNGIRAVLQKGFLSWVKENNFDIMCLQEVKAFETQIPAEIKFNMSDYNIVWHHGSRPGYAGTAIFFRKNIIINDQKSEFLFHEFSDEGRMTQIDFEYKNQIISLINCYFPNGGSRADGTEMLTYKLDFYEKIRQYVQNISNEGKHVIVCGDFNICHTEIDIARPKENENSIGFLPIEREEMDKLEVDGLVDMFRYFNPGVKDQYTWWSYRAGSRPRNIGWRLDYFWISSKLVKSIKSVQHQVNVEGSDHCPIVLDM